METKKVLIHDVQTKLWFKFKAYCVEHGIRVPDEFNKMLGAYLATKRRRSKQ